MDNHRQRFATGAAAQSPIGDAGDDQGANFNDTSTSNNPRIEQSLTVGSSSTVYIQFDFTTVGVATNSGFQIRDGSTGLNLHMMGQGANLNQVQVNQQGIGFGNVGTLLANDTWYRFTLTIDPENTAIDNFDMRIQSIETAALDDTYTNLLFQNNLTNFANLRFHYNTGGSFVNGQYRIDNFLVTTDSNELNFDVIPTPAALPAGLALLTFAAMRRRK